MNINCISGSTAKHALRMTNNGPIPVIYKFLWAGESIEIQREAHNVGVELHRNINIKRTNILLFVINYFQ